MADGQVVFEITADGKQAIASVKDITKAIESEGKKWDNSAKQSTDNINDHFSGMLKKVAAGFSAAKIGQALLNIGKDAIAAASDLQEVQNVVDVTFGDNAGKIEAWAKKAGTQFGLTETQAKKFTSTLGAMMKSAGMSGDEIVTMSTDLAGLAADMASFYNLDFETAFQKIRSGISGETEPLKQLGINMSTANLEAFALQQGLSKTWDEMDQGEQTMLRYQYMMQATADAQGDFSRTSTGYANSLRSLETNIESLKTKLGTVLVPAIGNAIGWINSMISAMTTEQERTVLDDFADIDLNTEAKIAEITETANEARSLVAVLDGIKSSTAAQNLQNIASQLSNIKLDQSKTEIINEFLSVMRQNMGAISEITGKDTKGIEQWLTDVADGANSLNPESAEGWGTIVKLITEGLPGLENTNAGSELLNTLAGTFNLVGIESGTAADYLDSLGIKTDEVADKNQLWLETCRRLVQTIPGLSSIINTETGEINGGTQAVLDYIKAWEDGQKQIALLEAVEKKRQALYNKFQELPGLEVEVLLKTDKYNKALKQLQDYATKFGISFDLQDGRVDWSLSDAKKAVGLTDEEADIWNREVASFEVRAQEMKDAQEAYDTQNNALQEGLKIIEEQEAVVKKNGEAIDKVTGKTEDAANAAKEWGTELKEAGTAGVNATNEAVKALADYVQGVWDETNKSINSVVSGLNGISTPTFEVVNLNKELEDLNYATGDTTDKIDALNKKINETKSKTFSVGDITKNLQSQIKYLEGYQKAIEQVRQSGLNEDLISSLSDGSTESFEYLVALSKIDANTDEGKAQIEEINQLWEQAQAGKTTLTDTLTQQKLSVDDTYAAMVETAKNAISQMDLGPEAEQSGANTVEGLANGIAAHVPDVAAAVDAIIAELNRLNGWGITTGDLGLFGWLNLGSVASLDVGMDYVPYDGYLASLHEGESVLTAEENRIWQRFKNGGSTQAIDYDTLGGVIGENSKGGGNVYLDGTTVGRVVSERQAASYRSLKRSGWQA